MAFVIRFGSYYRLAFPVDTPLGLLRLHGGPRLPKLSQRVHKILQPIIRG